MRVLLNLLTHSHSWVSGAIFACRRLFRWAGPGDPAASTLCENLADADAAAMMRLCFCRMSVIFFHREYFIHTFWNRFEIFKARIVDGLNLPFSIALMVCLLTSRASAKSCWVISRRALSTYILFFISHPPHIYPYHHLVEYRVCIARNIMMRFNPPTKFQWVNACLWKLCIYPSKIIRQILEIWKMFVPLLL